MKYDPYQLLEDFYGVAKLSGAEINRNAINLEILTMPHKQPTHLPKGKQAVYVFSEDEQVLKVGKAGSKSQARFVSHHYNLSAPSTLAKSILNDEEKRQKHNLTAENISDWIKQNTDRVNFLVDADSGKWILNLLEAFIQCKLKPLYEGHR